MLLKRPWVLFVRFHKVFGLLPVFDFTASSQASRERRDMLREIYDQYDGWITVGGTKTKVSCTLGERGTLRGC